MPDYTLEGEDGAIRLADIFDGESQLIVYNHMWFPGETWQCSSCTGFTSHQRPWHRAGWPQSPTYSRWSGSEAIGAAYGPQA